MGTAPRNQKSTPDEPNSRKTSEDIFEAEFDTGRAGAEDDSPGSGRRAGDPPGRNESAHDGADATPGADPAAAADADADADADAKRAGRRSDRGALAVAGVALAACAGLVLYGVFADEEAAAPKPKAVPSAEVTYEVTGTGTVDISYRAIGASGSADKAATASAVRLPWKKTVEVPLGEEPVISITLGERGGEARCALAIRGAHVRSATAVGDFGRATCSGTLPE